MGTRKTAVTLPNLDTNQFIDPHNDIKGWWHTFFHARWTWRWLSSPRLYFRPGLEYCVGGSFQVVDCMGRTKTFDHAFDSVFDAQDGRIQTLYVQTTNSLCHATYLRPNCTWKRTVIPNVAPMQLRMANLPYQLIPEQRRHDPTRYLAEDWFIVAALWLPAVVLIYIGFYFPSEGQPGGKNPLMYLPLPSCNLRYPRLARNILENRPGVVANSNADVSLTTNITLNANSAEIGVYRALRPRYLFYMMPVHVPDEDNMRWGSELRPVSQDDVTPYIFVAFTSEHFPLSGPNVADTLESLRLLGEEAAIEYFNLKSFETGVNSNPADLPRVAFWLSSECIPDNRFIDKSGNERALGSSNEDQLQRGHLVNIDTYSISDIVRGSEQTYVLSGTIGDRCFDCPEPRQDRKCCELIQDKHLKTWGSRVWTLPEIVLCRGDSVVIFHCWKLGTDVEERCFEKVSKIMFAKRAWSDASYSRQLIEHYGNLPLTQLEFSKVALQCLMNRRLKTVCPGDRSYAMMGLLRIRPQIDMNDSAFQAFARLSLPQDNDRLMERLICLLPTAREESWENMSDQYSSNLWDIQPETQVCAVGDTDTIIIDGAKGAQIQWNGLSAVRNIRSFSWTRWVFEKLAFIGPTIFMFAIIYIQTQQETTSDGSSNSIFTALIVLTILFCILPSPFYIWKLHMGKLWDVEPCFFGIEGYVPIEFIEEKLFGSRLGRMTWSPYGSPLSRHRSGEMLRERSFKYEQDDEESYSLIRPSIVDTYTIDAIDPCTPCAKCDHLPMNSRRCEDHPTELSLWEKSRGEFGQLKVFTLVNTFDLTATLFYAVRPPTALIIGGSEGGMKRAIACSFDMTTGIMYRETVLRLPSDSKDRMEAIPRIRLGISRPFIPEDFMVSQQYIPGGVSNGAIHQASVRQLPTNNIPLAPFNSSTVHRAQVPGQQSQFHQTPVSQYAQPSNQTFQQYQHPGVVPPQGISILPQPGIGNTNNMTPTPPLQPTHPVATYQVPQYGVQQQHYQQQQQGSPMQSYAGSPYTNTSQSVPILPGPEPPRF